MMKRKVAADDSIDGAEADASRKRRNAATPHVEPFHPQLFGRENVEELTESYRNAKP